VFWASGPVLIFLLLPAWSQGPVSLPVRFFPRRQGLHPALRALPVSRPDPMAQKKMSLQFQA